MRPAKVRLNEELGTFTVWGVATPLGLIYRFPGADCKPAVTNSKEGQVVPQRLGPRDIPEAVAVKALSRKLAVAGLGEQVVGIVGKPRPAASAPAIM
jgi:hypothetical protein